MSRSLTQQPAAGGMQVREEIAMFHIETARLLRWNGDVEWLPNPPSAPELASENRSIRR